MFQNQKGVTQDLVIILVKKVLVETSTEEGMEKLFRFVNKEFLNSK